MAVNYRNICFITLAPGHDAQGGQGKVRSLWRVAVADDFAKKNF